MRLSLYTLSKRLEQQIASVIGIRIPECTPSASLSLPLAAELTDVIPNGKRYGGLNIKGEHLTVHSKYMRGGTAE